MERKSLTFVMMDPPFEDARTVTALRLVDAAVRRGHDVTVFAYEGAVALPFARQAPHANAITAATQTRRTTRFPRTGWRRSPRRRSGAVGGWTG